MAFKKGCVPWNKGKQFCPKGHDTFIYGRKKGECKQCIKDRNPLPNNGRPKQQFCKNGHDISVVGKHADGRCIACQRNYLKKRREEHSKEFAEYMQKYYEENKEELKIKSRKWREEHPEVVKAINMRNATNRNLCIVSWSDLDKIKEIDHNCPKDMTIDHYIPLQGKLVWGLHVSWNLQYLTPLANSKKSRKIDLLEASDWYGKILEKAGLK